MENSIFDLLREVYFIFFHFFKWITTSNFGNILGIFSIIIGVYFFFKGFKRLVYSIESNEIISDKLKSVENLEFVYKDKQVSSLCVSELIIYNNGQKSINIEDVSNLTIKSIKGRIFDCIELKKHDSSVWELTNDTISIKLNEFDSKDYLVLRIFHESNLEIKGRIKESGELLNRESKLWVVINFVIFISNILALFWSINKIDENDITSWKWTIVTIITSMIIYYFLNLISSIFFIPSRITKKYIKKKR